MAEREFGVTNFVRGMAWHDAAKPFILDTGPHSALGHWLLRRAGFPSEAKVALAHGASSRNKTIRQYLKSGGAPLPAVLLLCNTLDIVAASVYSFQSRRPQDPDNHSMQNPFSRLVIWSSELDSPFAVPNEERVDELFMPLREAFIERLPDSWQNVVTPDSMEAAMELNPDTIAVDPLPSAIENWEAMQVIEQFMMHYPERTYPSVNDTSLFQHCRLSSILAFVVYRNLAHGPMSHWLDAEVGYEGENLKRPDENDRRVVMDHLAASLVRISFTGYQTLYKDAVRVDDLHGALDLADRTRQAFKEALVNVLGAPDLAEFLTINESQFDLFYLLPGTVDELAAQVNAAYETAIDRVTGEVVHRMARDFGRFGIDGDELRRQMGTIEYGLRILSLELPETRKLGPFATEYGDRLLTAYRESLDQRPEFPSARLPQNTGWNERTDPVPAVEICDVCGDHPILAPPENLEPEAEKDWRKKRDHAAHIFRGEREQVCLLCTARRTMAYGAIAKQMDPIVHSMLEPVAGQPGAWRSKEPDAGPALPPLLPARISISADDEMVEAGAFYVRYRQGGEGVDRSDVDIFPTTSYAADATGNVVMLSLKPTESLFETYRYDEALEALEPAVEEQLAQENEAFARWRETYQAYHAQLSDPDAEKSQADLAPPVRHVAPHLARVLERIQRLQVFYDHLVCRLADAPPRPEEQDRLRVLPLDTRYPTLRLLAPADRLDEALERLETVHDEVLMSTGTAEVESALPQRFLRHLLPALLHGTVVLFKQKFPLYLVLEAERDLFRQLAAHDDENWYGLRLGFTDLRGTLSEVGPQRAEVAYADLGEVLGLARDVDRRTVLLRAKTAAHITPELANALTKIRADHVRVSQQQAQRLNDKEIFPPVLFLKRATRG